MHFIVLFLASLTMNSVFFVFFLPLVFLSLRSLLAVCNSFYLLLFFSILLPLLFSSIFCASALFFNFSSPILSICLTQFTLLTLHQFLLKLSFIPTLISSIFLLSALFTPTILLIHLLSQTRIFCCFSVSAIVPSCMPGKHAT